MPEKKRSSNKREDRSLEILIKEYDSLRDMYNQSVHSGQTMFNYYLTLMTAVFGGITFVSQPSSGIFLAKTTMGLLLIFLAVIGTFYLSSLTSNHAHIVRYARGINDLRRFIIGQYNVSMPSSYEKFLRSEEKGESSTAVFLLSLFVPVSTYQLFTATINSLAWGFMVGIVYFGNAASPSLLQFALPGVLTLIITFIIYSVYSRLIFRMTISRATVSVEL